MAYLTTLGSVSRYRSQWPLISDRPIAKRRSSGVLRGHMHISPFHSLAPESEGARRARRRSVIDCLEAIVREGNLNSRTTPQGSPPKAVRSARSLDFKIPLALRSAKQTMTPSSLIPYSTHTSRRAPPSPACWGRGREAPDGVWPAASGQVGLHYRHREPFIDGFLLSTPHPPLRGTFPASRRRGITGPQPPPARAPISAAPRRQLDHRYP